jgi:hypothetical protein
VAQKYRMTRKLFSHIEIEWEKESEREKSTDGLRQRKANGEACCLRQEGQGL